MKQALLPQNIKNATVLVAAMDWGMGHTTRCVSIIRVLLENNNRVIFAGNKHQSSFLKKDFSSIEFVHLDGYNIQLNGKKNTYLQLIQQAPKFKKAIKHEHNWLNNFVTNRKIDCIISDNRYGFYHLGIQSVLITHQLNLQLPLFKSIVNKKLHSWISKFNVVWVPDSLDRKLTGELSNPNQLKNVFFIDPLCRFKPINAPIKYGFLIILSGPEPERSNFLTFILNKLSQSSADLPIAFVGALVSNHDSFENPSTAQLELLIAQSNIIISRAGYTTIMEMVALQKNAHLYPTKGQFEQTYLAKTVKHPKIKFI